MPTHKLIEISLGDTNCGADAYDAQLAVCDQLRDCSQAQGESLGRLATGEQLRWNWSLDVHRGADDCAETLARPSAARSTVVLAVLEPLSQPLQPTTPPAPARDRPTFRSALEHLTEAAREMEGRFSISGQALAYPDVLLLTEGAKGRTRNELRELVALLQLIGAGEPTGAVRELAQDALAALPADGYSIPRGGIRYVCEACGSPEAHVLRRRKLTRGVPWFSFRQDPWDASRDWLSDELVKHGVPRQRVTGYIRRDDDDRYWIGRRLVVCGDCLSGQIRRCGHETLLGKPLEWKRCTSPTVGRPLYCKLHRTRASDYARSETASARKAPDSDRLRRREGIGCSSG